MATDQSCMQSHYANPHHGLLCRGLLLPAAATACGRCCVSDVTVAAADAFAAAACLLLCPLLWGVRAARRRPPLLAYPDCTPHPTNRSIAKFQPKRKQSMHQRRNHFFETSFA